ncbi:MAG: LemA family protein [Gemmatimonadota bacterium]|nr:LemA family protein [Gemmatimonadota bacterium]
MIKQRRFLALVLPAALLLTGCGYNQIQTLDEQAQKAKQQIEVQLQRRADLIPNLAATVKGVTKQEDTVYIGIANARARLAGAVKSGDPAEMAAADQQATGAIGRLLAIAENYPQLKSNENFMALQDELTGTENRVAVARGDYNSAVQAYNTYIRTFPQAITAKVTGAKERTYYNAAPGTENAPTVKF